MSNKDEWILSKKTMDYVFPVPAFKTIESPEPRWMTKEWDI